MSLSEVSEIEESLQKPITIPEARLDAYQKVSGKVKFTRDLAVPGMLYAKIKRCPYPHARILSIDTSEASKLKGVRAVITGRDFPTLTNEATPALAVDEVLYANQSVVAVAADTRATATEALGKIAVEYEQLPGVFDAELAMSPSTPVVIRTGPHGKNIGNYVRVRRGDVDRAFARADMVVENTYTTAVESSFAMETVSFLAQPDIDGGVTIWSTSGGAHATREDLVDYLPIDPARIRVKVGFLGGWYGSKEEQHIAAICAMLAMKSSRPVKLELTREETMTATAVRHPAKIHVKDAVMRDGRITGRQIRAVYDGGAYGVVGNKILPNSILAAVSVYNIPNFRMDSYRVYTNRVPGAAKPATMGPQIIWAVEGQMDVIASKLKTDPVGFRIKNLLHEGDENAIGEKMQSISHEASLMEVAGRMHPSKRTSHPDGIWRDGVGFAIASKWVPAGGADATVKITETGKALVWVDAVENGQGIFTGLSQIVATELAIPIEDVTLMPLLSGAESEVSGQAAGASGSRQLVYCGNAVLSACKDVKRRIVAQAGRIFGLPANNLEMKGRRVVSKTDPSISFDLPDLFDRWVPDPEHGLGRDKTFTGFGSFTTITGQMDPETGQTTGGPISPFYVTVAQGIEVSVNTETGRVKVRRVVASMDVGRAINPELVRGQIRGSVATGLGAALSEELVLSDGRVVNPHLADYKLLTSVDVPPIDAIVVETPYKYGPYGAKGAGNPSIVPVCAAVRNAIHDAVGVWIDSLPMTPEKVLAALSKK